MFKSLCFIIYFLTLSSVVYSGTIDPSVSDVKYIEYGKKHTCVLPMEGSVKVNVIDKNGDVVSKSVKYMASCVAISPRWVITAAHVIKNTDSRYVVFDNEKIQVELFEIPEEFDHQTFGKKDIALCYLSKAINLSFYPELYAKTDEIGKVNSQAGFGGTGTFSSGAIKLDNEKRAGSNIIQSIRNDLLLCTVHEGKKTSLEFMIANGDSGGGLFIDNKLAGIHSCVFADDGSPNSDYGDTSGHTRISVFREWIKETISLVEKNIEKK